MVSTRVDIYDQPYAIGGGDEATIRRLAERVDAKMRQVARETKVVDSLRIAVLAAMNLADELATAAGENDALRARLAQLERGATDHSRTLAARARDLNRDLDQLLARSR